MEKSFFFPDIFTHECRRDELTNLGSPNCIAVFLPLQFEYFHTGLCGALTGVSPYLLRSVDVFVEPFKGIDVELHELSQQIKVTLKDITRRTAAVDYTEQDVLSRD